VWDSVRDFVEVYIGSFFPNIKKWKYIDHATGVYPYQSAADLWKQGLVPSFDNKTWRLRCGPDGKICYEVNVRS
jgi:hypothetical protein